MQFVPCWLSIVAPLQLSWFSRQKALHRDLVLILPAPHPSEQLGEPFGDAPPVLGSLDPQPVRDILWQRNGDVFHDTKIVKHEIRVKARWAIPRKGTVNLSRIRPFCGRILLKLRPGINDLQVVEGDENAAKQLNLTIPSRVLTPATGYQDRAVHK